MAIARERATQLHDRISMLRNVIGAMPFLRDKKNATHGLQFYVWQIWFFLNIEMQPLSWVARSHAVAILLACHFLMRQRQRSSVFFVLRGPLKNKCACMHVCMYVFMYVLYVYMYVRTCVRTYARMYIGMLVGR